MPADYVNKLARMFQDIKVSDDLNQEFKDAHRNNNEGIAGEIQNFENSHNISVPVQYILIILELSLTMIVNSPSHKIVS